MEPPAAFAMNEVDLVTTLARAFLSGEAAASPIVERCARMLGRNWRWLRPLAGRYLAATKGRTRPRRREVIQFLHADPGFREALFEYRDRLRIDKWLDGIPEMQPVPAARDWDIPQIETTGDLAAWLQVTPNELLWFADLRALGYKQASQQLRHYHYRVLSKEFGSVRLIEAPKPRLKEMQRRILTGILDCIPAHAAAHGFVPGRSIRTFAAPHVNRPVVVRMDLQDFFPSFPGVRIQSFFRTAGYPEAVADLLGGICTNAAPRDVWASVDADRAKVWEAWKLYARPHLPQGAPTSPALANICSYRMDCRLAGLADSAGAVYTRYADDLAFSGDDEFARRAERFSAHAAAVVIEEGFQVHHRKTRIMRRGVRQYLAGLVTNQRVNVARREFDLLKATLHNCVRFGPGSQNRQDHPQFRAHLEGRVAFLESVNPEKGLKLRTLFYRIKWS